MTFLKKTTAIIITLAMLAAAPGCRRNNIAPAGEKIKRPNEAFLTYGDTNETIVELSKVNSSVWVHTS